MRCASVPESESVMGFCYQAALGDGPNVTERAQSADSRRKPQICHRFTPAPGNSSISRSKPQKTADFRRNPKFSQKTAGNRALVLSS